MSSGFADSAERFSLVVGGPFHTALRRLGLTGSDRLPTRRAALLLALLAWLPPALLVGAQSLFDASYDGRGYFTDLTAYTRYLVAIWVMVVTERHADGRIRLLARHFRESGLLGDEAGEQFTLALERADRRSSSAAAEGIIAVVALLWPGLTASYAVTLTGSSWEGRLSDGVAVLSWAGSMARFVSAPLFLFLVLRWFWRFGVWTALMLRISGLTLQLTPLHPDRVAGLGFLAIYPSIFSGFVFALSCVVASALLKDLAFESVGEESVWLALATWPALSAILFLSPLLVFVRPLYQARERALLEYGRLATRHHLAFHRKWIAGSQSAEELMGSSDHSSVSDLNASVQAVLELRVVPVDLAAVLQLLVAAGLPLLAVVATQVPLLDLLRWFVGTLL